MKWFENNSWRLEKCHSRFFVTPDLFRGRISLFTFFFSLVFLVLLSACTDYVSQIDDRYGEWETSIEPNVKSSCSAAKSSSSSVVKSSSSASSSSSWSGDFMTDSRNGQTYKIVKIGEQTWMAENLNYETENSYCYNDTASYCAQYGLLYTWAVAMDVCPSGWHLPSRIEWEALFTAVGGISTAGKVLKSLFGWSNNYDDKSGNGTDAFLFSALPAGVRGYDGEYLNERNFATFWSSTEDDGNGVYVVDLNYYSDDANLNKGAKNDGYSVRCIKDEKSEQMQKSSSSVKSSSSSVAKSSGSVKSSSSVKASSSSVAKSNSGISSSSSWNGELMTDSRDGQTYKIVTIGTQTWMAENLNYEIEKSYCYNDTASYCDKYGRLYTWAAAMDVCPSGWHLPSRIEWDTLFTAVGGKSTAGKVLKSSFGWDGSGNGGDVFSFSMLPAGYRNIDGDYYRVGYYAIFWSSTESDHHLAYYMYLNKNIDEASLGLDDQDNGFSVRCLKD